MNATPCGILCQVKPLRRLALLGLVGLGVASAGEASAGSIKLHTLSTPEKGETTAEYFQRMLDEHVTRITVAELDRGRSTLHAEASGLLPDTSFVEYMRWRQSLNVERFDCNHPCIAVMLRKDATVRSLQTVPQELVSSPTIASTPTSVAAESLSPPPASPPYIPPSTVPEPGTAVLAIALIGSATFARRWVRRQG